MDINISCLSTCFKSLLFPVNSVINDSGRQRMVASYRAHDFLLVQSCLLQAFEEWTDVTAFSLTLVPSISCVTFQIYILFKIHFIYWEETVTQKERESRESERQRHREKEEERQSPQNYWGKLKWGADLSHGCRG